MDKEITIVLVPKSGKKPMDTVEQIRFECAVRSLVEKHGFNVKEVIMNPRTDK